MLADTTIEAIRHFAYLLAYHLMNAVVLLAYLQVERVPAISC